MPVQVRNLNLKPDVQTTAGTPKELLPRQSFLGTAHERAVASPATASETTLIDEVGSLGQGWRELIDYPLCLLGRKPTIRALWRDRESRRLS